MNTLREAAQQALEALEDYKRSDDDRVSIAMHILRAALAEPTPLEDALTYGTAWTKGGKRIDPMSVYAEPTVKESLTDEPGQPVMYAVHGGQLVGLHPAPPQRQPLTDAAIWRTYQGLWPFHPAEEPALADDILKFARAIEARHGIGDSNGS